MEADKATAAIHEAAVKVLAADPTPAVAVRLLRDVLGRPRDDPDLAAAREGLDDNPWVKMLRECQDKNGNFPRLRPDLRHLGIFEATHIGLAVGLEPDGDILSRVRDFAERVLDKGVAESRDILVTCPFSRTCGNPYWELCLAVILARLAPRSALIGPVLEKHRRIVEAGFGKGDLDVDAARAAAREVFGLTATQARHGDGVSGTAVPLIAWNANALDQETVKRFFAWHTERIPGRLSVLTHPAARDPESSARPDREATGACSWILRRLWETASMPGWDALMAQALPLLWESQGDDGLWDYGKKAMSSGFDTRMMISGPWRSPVRRKHDWSTWVLCLLQRYYQGTAAIDAVPAVATPPPPEPPPAPAKPDPGIPVFPHAYTIRATKPRGHLARLLAAGGANIVPIDGEPEIDRYIVSDRLAIERRTGSSFLVGLMDKTLFTSALTLREHFQLPVFVLEGQVNLAYRGFDPQAVRGALSAMMLEYELNVIQTPGMHETAHMIAMMARQEIEGVPEISVIPKRTAASLADQQRRLIEMLPGCGRVMARELLQRFRSIDGIVRATEEDLCTVRGLGAKKAKQIRLVLTAEYEAIDTEKQLEDAIEFDQTLIFEQPVSMLARQHYIFDDDQGRHIVDMVFHDPQANDLILVELKRGMLHPWHRDQLRRYLDRATDSPMLRQWLEAGCTLRGVLASPSPGGLTARAKDMTVVDVDEKRAIAALKQLH